MIAIFSFPYSYEAGYAGANCPNETSCNGGFIMPGTEDHSIHDYIFNASAGDKIWRGFVLGCAIGLFVAALFCCWAPCFRFGARGAVVRAWRYPRRAVTDAEGQRRGAEGNDMTGARQSPPGARFVDRATLISVRDSG